MDDLTAFERQLSGEIAGLMGPVHPVDDLAVFDGVMAASRRKGWGLTMVSTLKFVAAGVIVALFGGFLLAGVLTAPRGEEMAPGAVTEPPTPMTSEGRLSGMVTEEVEPGILQVVNDGERDLTSVEALDIVAGYDGGLWLLGEEGFLRLGSDGSHRWPPGVTPKDHVFEVAPDGTMWLIPRAGYPDMRRGDPLRSADGEQWAVQPCPTACKGVSVAPDGTLWATWRDEADWRWQVGHLGPTGWLPLAGYIPDNGSATGLDRLYLTDAGDVYGVRCGWACGIHRYEDGRWPDLGHAYMLVDVGPDGTVWRDGIDGYDLARRSDDRWTGWTSADVPDLQFGFSLDEQFQVAPDGSLWFSRWQPALGEPASWGDEEGSRWERRREKVEDGRLMCDGLARFDGASVDHFLPGRCVSMDIAADGSVWVLAGQAVYVITLSSR